MVLPGGGGLCLTDGQRGAPRTLPATPLVTTTICSSECQKRMTLGLVWTLPATASSVGEIQGRKRWGLTATCLGGFEKGGSLCQGLLAMQRTGGTTSRFSREGVWERHGGKGPLSSWEGALLVRCPERQLVGCCGKWGAGLGGHRTWVDKNPAGLLVLVPFIG